HIERETVVEDDAVAPARTDPGVRGHRVVHRIAVDFVLARASWPVAASMSVDGGGVFAVVDDSVVPEDVAGAVVRGHSMPVPGKRVVFDKNVLQRTEPQRGPGAITHHDDTVAQGTEYRVAVVHVRERVLVDNASRDGGVAADFDPSGEVLQGNIMDSE